MQLASNAIILLLSLLAAFSHCAPKNHGKTNPSINERKAKNNPPTSSWVLPSLAKVATGALALTAGLPCANCASRPFGYGNQADTAVNFVDAANPPVVYQAPAPTQSFSPDDDYKTPPGKQKMRRRMTKNNKSINAVEHFGRGGGGGSGGGGGGLPSGYNAGYGSGGSNATDPGEQDIKCPHCC
ncbi:hypothetical protein niasHT_003969 [Heterodera trifolii]|uniref:Uncharacterized protein n=1 Tax=Heterodera trifolii TaxID=157864 RepID=A0ABD2M529_9BILA